MSDQSETFNELRALPMFEAERGATAEEILTIESELGVVLPQEYADFLREFGYVSWFGHSIFGIQPTVRIPGTTSYLRSDCVNITRQQRDPSNMLGTSNLPSSHVIVATDGGGGNFVLFTVGSPYEGEVHWYNFEDGEEPVMTWETFHDFLKYMIANSPEP